MVKSIEATTYLAAVSVGTVGANLDKTVFDGEVSWRRVPGDTSHPIYPGWVPDGPADPRHYHVAESDRVELSDGAMTGGGAALTSASAGFTEDYVGRTALVYGAGAVGVSGDALVTTVSAYVSASELTLADNAAATVSGADVVIASNSHAELVAWLDAGGIKRGVPGAVIEMGPRTGGLRHAEHSRTDYAGMKLKQNFYIPSENSIGAIFEGAVVENLNYEASPQMYVERGLTLYLNSTLRNSRFIFPNPITPAETDDQYDSVIAIREAGALIENVFVEGGFRVIDFYSANADDRSRCVLRNITMENQWKGVTFDSNAEYTLIDGLFNYGANPDATTEPGNNGFVGGAQGSLIKDYYQFPVINSNGEVSGAGEHGWYSAVADGTYGMTFDRIRLYGSGQSGGKMRGHTAWRLFDFEAGVTSVGNSSGTNEDVLRQEYCRDGHAVGIRSFKQATLVLGPSGFDGIHLMHCWDNLYELISLDRPTRCYLHLSTNSAPAPEYSTSPNAACEGLTFRGFEAYNAALGTTRPFLMLGSDAGDDSVKIGDVTVLKLDYDGPVASLVETQAGITTVTQVAGTRLYIDGRADDKRITYEWVDGSAPTIFYHNPRDLTDTVANLTALTTAASPALGEAVVPVGQRAFATDATATTFASAAAGGGANTVPVWWDGSDWLIG